MLDFTRLLLYLSLVLAVAASSSPNNFGLHHRDHVDLARLVRKRTPADPLGNQLAAQALSTPSALPAAQSTQDTSATPQTTPASSSSAQSTPASASASASASTPASASPSAASSGLLSSVVGGLLSTESSTTSSTRSTTSSSISSYSSSAPETSDHPGNTPATTPTQSILYVTSSAAPTPTQTSSVTPSGGISHAAVTVLIVIAASVGAAVIVWTIIRKWKFRPSSDFEGRMQPIDWQPGGNDEGTGLPHRPLSRASSFHSGSANAHTDDQMRGPVGGYGTTTLSPIPDHDFTAGPAHLTPVGGYADLARGPSPQPMMQESYGVAPSINRPIQYDQHGVPLYHGYGGY